MSANITWTPVAFEKRNINITNEQFDILYDVFSCGDREDTFDIGTPNNNILIAMAKVDKPMNCSNSIYYKIYEIISMHGTIKISRSYE